MTINLKNLLNPEKKISKMGEFQELGHISGLDIPLSGHFIDYRRSMVNWCPIGRNANPKQRKQFIRHDNSQSPTLRQKELDKVGYKINLRCQIL